MKRLAILTVVAMMTVATSNGCRTCGSLFNFNRGDACNMCDAGSYGPYDAPVESGVVYEGDTMLPPVTSEMILPGPVGAAQ